MAHPGKYSNVEVLRKYVAGVSPEAGTTQTVGSGLKPRSTGLEKVSGSGEADMVSGVALDDTALDGLISSVNELLDLAYC